MADIFVCLFYPEKTFFLFNKCRYQVPELSDTGRKVEQIGGIVLSVVGVGIMSGLWVVIQ